MAVFKDKEKTKDGRQWYFKVYKKDFDNNNKAYKSKRYLTKKEAQEEESLFLMKRDNPTHKSFVLVAHDYIQYIYKSRKESTGYSYEKDYNLYIAPFFKNYNIDEIDINVVRNWKETIDKYKLSLKYKNGFYNVLKGIFDYGIKNYGLNSNPIQILGRFEERHDEVIKDEEKIRYITYDDFQKFINCVDDLKWKTFYIFLYYTGMRIGEVQALNWNDINFTNNYIVVNKTLTIKTSDDYKITTTKNYLNRKISMSNVLKNQLLEYKESQKSYTDFEEDWFVFGGTRFLPYTTMARYKKDYFKLANVKEITFHEFRHSHVSLVCNEFIKRNESPDKFFEIMASRMGHSVEVMKNCYMHWFPTMQDNIVDILNDL